MLRECRVDSWRRGHKKSDSYELKCRGCLRLLLTFERFLVEEEG